MLLSREINSKNNETEAVAQKSAASNPPINQIEDNRSESIRQLQLSTTANLSATTSQLSSKDSNTPDFSAEGGLSSQWGKKKDDEITGRLTRSIVDRTASVLK